MESSFLTLTIGLIYYLVSSIFLWPIFIKANEKGWYALIPIFNLIVVLRIIDKPWGWIFLLFFPYVNIIFWVWVHNLLRLKFNKGSGFLLGLIFLSIVFLPILAFDNSKYKGKFKRSKIISFKVPLLYSCYFSLFLILIQIILWVTNLNAFLGIWQSILMSILNYFILIFMLVLFTKNYRNKFLGGEISYDDAFNFGILMILISSIVLAFYFYVFNTFIDPEFIHRTMLMTKDKLYESLTQKGMSENQIDAIIMEFDKSSNKSILSTSALNLIIGLLGGSLFALISAAFVKKQQNEDAFDEAMEEVKNED